MEKTKNAVLLAARCYGAYYWSKPWVRSASERIGGLRCDAVIANEVEMLPIAVRLFPDTPILFDAHEYYPRQYEDRVKFRMVYAPLYNSLLAKYLPGVAAMTTVSVGLALQYRRHFGIDAVVLPNLPVFTSLKPSNSRLASPIRLIHHGTITRSRQLERMVDLMRYVDARYELYMMLLGSRKYVESLRHRARFSPRIHFLDPVPMRQIPQFINQFDIGLYILPPVNFNQRHALPNKFFEFIQARLGVAIGPSPEMAQIVHQHDLGVVSSDFKAKPLAKELNRLTMDDVSRFKQNADRVAAKYSSDAATPQFVDLVGRLLQEDRPSCSDRNCQSDHS